MANEGLNKVMLIGNLGQDPEVKFTQGGQAILRLRLATTERYANKSGERQERTEWHTAVVWGNRAEALGKILSKGRTIYVEGRLQTSSWDDKDGKKQYKTEINATQILLLGGGRSAGQGDEFEGGQASAGGSGAGGGAGGARSYGGNRGGGNAPPPDDFGGGDFGGGDDDIPF